MASEKGDEQSASAGAGTTPQITEDAEKETDTAASSNVAEAVLKIKQKLAATANDDTSSSGKPKAAEDTSGKQKATEDASKQEELTKKSSKTEDVMAQGIAKIQNKAKGLLKKDDSDQEEKTEEGASEPSLSTKKEHKSKQKDDKTIETHRRHHKREHRSKARQRSKRHHSVRAMSQGVVGAKHKRRKRKKVSSSSSSLEFYTTLQDRCKTISMLIFLSGIAIVVVSFVSAAFFGKRPRNLRIILFEINDTNGTNDTFGDYEVTTELSDTLKLGSVTLDPVKALEEDMKNNPHLYITIDGKTYKRGWNEWSSWSKCSTTCGAGNIVRRKKCYGPKCPEPREITETIACHKEPCLCNFLATVEGRRTVQTFDIRGEMEEISAHFPHPTAAEFPTDIVYDNYRFTLFYVEIDGSLPYRRVVKNGQPIIQLPYHLQSIAIDIGKQLIFVAAKHIGVMRADYLGGNQTWIIEMDSWRQAYAMEVFKADEMLYWFNWEYQWIERCTYDGKNQTKLYHHLAKSYGMYIDEDARKLYWVDTEGWLYFIHVDGPYERKSRHPKLGGHIGIDITYCWKEFYIVARKKSRGSKTYIYRIHKTGGARRKFTKQSYRITNFAQWGYN